MNARFSCLLLALLAPACSPSAPEAPPLAGARIGGPFALIDQDGRARTDRDFAGRWRIMYFGYTFCPDVCPVDVQRLAAGLRAFEARGAKRGAGIVPVFVTVDPARDTPAVLKQFVAAFHPRMIGLTGTQAAIDSVARAYGVYHAARPPGAGGGYMVDHGRQAYLMAPDGSPIALLSNEGTPDQIADELARWVR